jgi:hypothetical protein
MNVFPPRDLTKRTRYPQQMSLPSLPKAGMVCVCTDLMGLELKWC